LDEARGRHALEDVGAVLDPGLKHGDRRVPARGGELVEPGAVAEGGRGDGEEDQVPALAGGRGGRVDDAEPLEADGLAARVAAVQRIEVVARPRGRGVL